MRAAQIRYRPEPAGLVTLGQKSLSSRWTPEHGRPAGSLQMGLRIASANEKLVASTSAVSFADRLLPGRDPSDRRWAATYHVCWIHYLLGVVMCSPNDANAPLWAAQDGALLLAVENEGDAAVVSLRFSDAGLARLLDEYEALEISHSEVWPEISASDAKKLGQHLADDTFFAGLDEAARGGNGEAKHVAAQLRRLFGYVVHLRTHGRERAQKPE
jgi:hypothetical protein